MNEVILVSGGSRGIGRAIVQKAAEAGYMVAFTWRDAKCAAAVEEACGGRAKGFEYELRSRDSSALIERIEAELGAVDGLVNNAGFQHSEILAMTSDDTWNEVIDTNLSGAFRLTRAVLKGMVSRRRGVILSISSLSALHGIPGQTAYAASKAGLLAMTRCLAREVGKRNIRVNAIVPGFVDTDMTRELSPQVVSRLRATEALKDGTTVDSVADVVLFLLSDQARSITGQHIVVDAGSGA